MYKYKFNIIKNSFKDVSKTCFTMSTKKVNKTGTAMDKLRLSVIADLRFGLVRQ